MITIGKGETRTIIFKIEDENSKLAQTDTILFALKDLNGVVKKQYSQTVSQLTKTDNTYTFSVEITTSDLSICKYNFDLTLVPTNNKKVQIMRIKTLEVIDTVGAQIGG